MSEVLQDSNVVKHPPNISGNDYWVQGTIPPQLASYRCISCVCVCFSKDVCVCV